MSNGNSLFPGEMDELITVVVECSKIGFQITSLKYKRVNLTYFENRERIQSTNTPILVHMTVPKKLLVLKSIFVLYEPTFMNYK